MIFISIEFLFLYVTWGKLVTIFTVLQNFNINVKKRQMLKKNTGDKLNHKTYRASELLYNT